MSDYEQRPAEMAREVFVRCEDLSLDRLADEQRSRFKAIVHERVSEIEEKISISTSTGIRSQGRCSSRSASE